MEPYEPSETIVNIEYDLALPCYELIPLPNVTTSRRRKHVSSEKSTPRQPTRGPTQYHSVPEQARAPSVLSPPIPSRHSTPSPARDMYVSVHPRGAQPSCTHVARSGTCRTRRSSTWGTRGPYSTIPTDGRCIASSLRAHLGGAFSPPLFPISDTVCVVAAGYPEDRGHILRVVAMLKSKRFWS